MNEKILAESLSKLGTDTLLIIRDALKVKDERIEKLESTFRHIHVNQDGTDKCKQCGLDLRDLVHERLNQ